MKKEKGITLIALVITIIVLLILAGVSLSLVAGSDGILSKAGKAVEKNKTASAKEIGELVIMDVQADYYEQTYAEDGYIMSKAEYIMEALKDGKPSGNYVVKAEDGKIKVYQGEGDTLKEVASGTLTENGKMEWDDQTGDGSINKPTIESTVTYDGNGGDGTLPESKINVKQGTNVTVDTSVTLAKTGYSFIGWARNSDATEAITSFTMPGEDVTLYAVWISIAGGTESSKNRTLANATTGYSYKNPVIPQGFKAVDTTDAQWTYTNGTTVKGWNEGLVIEDVNNQNQFVWVPVDGENVKYEKANFVTTGAQVSEVKDDTSVYPVSDEKTQINTYGGFYVARYEAGFAGGDITAATNNKGTIVPVSKAGTKVWNQISYNNAAAAAKLMVNDSTKYGNNKSGIMTGTQWDTIMKWYQNAGIKIDTTQDWGSCINLNYSGTGYYYTKSSSSGTASWKNGSFNHTAVSSGNYPYHAHASGLNSNAIKKNIADLGGNLSEWTAEMKADIVIGRGGSYFDTVDICCISIRNNEEGATKTKYWINYGFRVALFIQ